MANYRTIQTRMWREDEWFQELDVDGRLLWIYLITNPSANAAGIYRISLRTAAFESGIDLKRVKALFEIFSRDGKAHYENGVVWVVKMRKYQFPNPNMKILKRIEKDLEEISDCELKDRYIAFYGDESDAGDNPENADATERISEHGIGIDGCNGSSIGDSAVVTESAEGAKSIDREDGDCEEWRRSDMPYRYPIATPSIQLSYGIDEANQNQNRNLTKPEPIAAAVLSDRGRIPGSAATTDDEAAAAERRLLELGVYHTKIKPIVNGWKKYVGKPLTVKDVNAWEKYIAAQNENGRGLTVGLMVSSLSTGHPAPKEFYIEPELESDYSLIIHV